LSIPEFLKKLKVRIIPENRNNLLDNYIVHPKLVERLVEDNKYTLVNSFVNVHNEGVVKDYDSFFEGLTKITRILKKEHHIRAKYVIQLKTNVYTAVHPSFFEIFVIEGSLFRKASIELICKNFEALNIFRIRRPL